MRGPWALAGSMVVALVVVEPRAASACTSRPPPAALKGYPNDGDVDVPTDVIPFYRSDSAVELDDAEFTLASSAGDDSVVLPVARAQRVTVELTPERALQPNTTYTLVAKLRIPAGPEQVDTLSLTFTTGGGPVSTNPDPPQAFLQQFQYVPELKTSCDPGTVGTCVAVSTGVPVEAALIDESGEEMPPFLYTDSWFTYLGEKGTPFRCVKLRTRAPNATYSSPTVLCGEGAPLITLSGSEHIACTSQGITQDGVLASSIAGAGGESAGGAPDAMTGGNAASGAGGDAAAPTSTSGGMAPAAGAGGATQYVRGCSVSVPSKRSLNTVLGGAFGFALLVHYRRRSRGRRR